MCIFSKPKAPEAPQVSQAPAPAQTPPPPTPSPEEASQISGDSRKRRIEQMKYGLASTIKSGKKGIFGRNSELASGSFYGKSKLGA
jgi:hypothetical protein